MCRPAAVLLGALCLAAGGLSLWQLGRAARLPWAGWAGLLLYPLHPLVAGTLGSETPLYLALGLGALSAYQRGRYRLAALCAGLAAVARPDGLLFAGVLGLDWLARDWLALRKGQGGPFPWQALAVFCLAWLPWILATSAYFGSPLPVTLAAKQQQGRLAVSSSFGEGFLQTARLYWDMWFFRLEIILVGIGCLYLAWLLKNYFDTRAPRLEEAHPANGVALLLGWTAVYFVAYGALGVTRYFWYYAPLLPALVVLMGLGLAAIERLVSAFLAGWKGGRPQAGQVLACLVCAGLALGQLAFLVQLPADARTAVYRQAGEWLSVHTEPSAGVGALEVGVIGYYAQRRMIDFAGLIQPEIAAQLGKQGSYAAAALWATQQYRPDYLVLQDRLFPGLEAWAVGKACSESARFPGLKWDMVVYTCKW